MVKFTSIFLCSCFFNFQEPESYLYSMKVFIIGTGGREHALAWKIANSPLCTRLFVARGNGGTLPWNVAVNPDQPQEVIDFCRQEAVDLVVIGPEQPLSEGLADALRNKGFAVCGPGQNGARLESSKVFSKAFMEKYDIPTANARSFDRDEFDDALHFAMQQPLPLVIKADGLAAGKGVIIAQTYDEALKTLDAIFHEDVFGPAGNQILIETFLKGIEASVFVLTDGTRWVQLPEAMDYKRAYDQNLGPNTGGMGAISPVPFFTPELNQYIGKAIIEPTLRGLKEEGIEYRGFLFLGLMTEGNQARVIEYNVRMGDPETEVVLTRIESDLIPYLYGAAHGAMPDEPLLVSSQAAVCTVCVSEGYPGPYAKGHLISLPDERPEKVFFFHAGTGTRDGNLVTTGGRVMAVTALAPTLAEAASRSQEYAAKVSYAGKFFRKDIGTY